MSSPEMNPFESPEVAEAPIIRGRAGKGPRAGEFGGLMLQLCVTGGLMALLGVVLSALYWPVGVPVLLLGSLLFATGRGLGAYKAWAWYAAIITLVPMNLALAAVFIYLAVVEGALGLGTIIGPAYCGYVLWALLSPSGRESYWRSVAAVERAKTDPNRVVRRRFRRSR